MQITLFAAVSANGLITDEKGNGDFSSPEDKTHLRSYLNSKSCDCFICGRKTAEEFQHRLTSKPLLILTRQKKENAANRIYFSTLEELNHILKAKNLSDPTLLGGAETYSFFFENGYVDRIVLTTENIRFNAGKSLDLRRFKNDFFFKKRSRLSEKTTVSFYQRKKPRE